MLPTALDIYLESVICEIPLLTEKRILCHDDYMVQKVQKNNLLINIVGWYGAVATLSAYFLISAGFVHGKDLSYQLLNFSGAIGLAIICYHKRTYQPLVVNIIWAFIAILAIVNIVFLIIPPQ